MFPMIRKSFGAAGSFKFKLSILILSAAKSILKDIKEVDHLIS